MADELHELKSRLSDLSRSVEELIARQKVQPGDESAEPPSTPKS